jgi:glycosyltransferase involved in cell wall biosynthesis
MHIWLMTNEYPPFFGGGIATYAKAAAHMYAQAGHQVTVFVQSNPLPKEKEIPNLRIIRFPKPECVPGNEIYQYLSYTPAVAYQYAHAVLNVLATEKTLPDIIETQDSLAIGYYLTLYKRLGHALLKKIPIVVNCHTPLFVVKRENHDNEYNKFNYHLGMMEKECLLYADALMSPSKYLKDDLQTILGEKEITVLPLPLPIMSKKVTHDERHARKIAGGSIDFLCIGRLEYRKGMKHFIEAAARLWAKGKKFRVVIVGADQIYHPYHRPLGAIIKADFGQYIQQGLLKLIDQVPQELVHSLMQAARAVVLPSLFENFPYVCVEAMYLAKPVLVSAQGGQAEMVGPDGSCGVVFDWGKENDAVSKIEKMNSLSSAELTQMGTKAHRRIVDLCNHEHNCEIRISYFSKVIAQSSKQKKQVLSVLGSRPVAPTVSVQGTAHTAVILTDNHSDQLASTVQSILQSTRLPEKIIIFRDTVTNPDITAQCDEYCRSLKIKTVCLDAQDEQSPLQSILEQVETAFICVIPANALLHKSFNERMSEITTKIPNLGCCYSWFQHYGADAKISPTFSLSFPWALVDLLLPPLFFAHTGLLKQYGSAENLDLDKALHDWTIQIVQNGYAGVAVPEVLHSIKITPEVTRLRVSQMKFLELIQARHEPLFKKYAADIVNLLQVNRVGG